WNDKLRPMEFIEVDKQAHKMIVAWLLCRLNSSGADLVRLEEEVIERAMFEYFFRLVVTDIKPPVYYRIKSNERDFRELAAWALAELEPVLRPLDEGFWQRMSGHILAPAKEDLAAQILDAAHNYASNWELSILSSMNRFDPEVPEIEEDFKRKLEGRRHLNGLPDMLAEGTALGRFARLCGQLRFQKRWSQTPRIPETSVMGHMFIVACYAWFFSLAVGACRARRVNNFFSALFHDLAELLTRDIISPVKKSFDALERLIHAYEDEELERRVFRPLRGEGYGDLVERLSYYLGQSVGSEFKECAVLDGKLRESSFEELQERYNEDAFDPKDGKLIKVCDSIAAFIEAYTAMRNGISSEEFHQATWRIRSANARLNLGGVHVGALLADFD
ncbi:HD domain-containing protein, partial [Desulfovibrio sp. OttesenSCG-928-C14]|nr:HD domain-containing protein [Desulfovibrio sp. OttesenSCG-928-C14]